MEFQGEFTFVHDRLRDLVGQLTFAEETSNASEVTMKVIFEVIVTVIQHGTGTLTQLAQANQDALSTHVKPAHVSPIT